MISPRIVAGFYVLFALLSLLILASTMPPFVNPDETPHAYRADQISHFGLLGQVLPDGKSGGTIDIGMALAHTPFYETLFGRKARVDRAMYRPIPWGRPVALGFPSMAPYPPHFYIPAALAIAASRATGVSVLHGLLAARVAGGLATIGISTLAIALADGAAALWLYTILLLPMAMAQTAAVSQDGPMFACTALAACLCRRIKAGDRAAFGAACLLLALVAMARPPYAAFALILLATEAPLRARLAGCGGVLFMTLGWCWLTSSLVRVPPLPEGVINPKLQLLGLVTSPAHIPALIITTWHQNAGQMAEEFVGVLGYLNVHLPYAYHVLARGVLMITLIQLIRCSRLRGMSLPLYFAAALSASFGIGLLLYMTWTKLNGPAVEGLQGRYFLPIAIMLAYLPQAKFPIKARHIGPGEWAVLIFPMFSIPVTLHAIIISFYI